MKEAFTLFDTDGDGKIGPSELGILMRSLGGNPTQAQLKSIIVEEKLNSPFDFNRFLELMSKHLKPEPFDRQLRDAFKSLMSGSEKLMLDRMERLSMRISLLGWLLSDFACDLKFVAV
ncbi:hypothetical protein K7X08_020165 [Anisodus acutangulus]|uniref:EF-hand domain-containing protein n=1 Tax=Anisodus acutangulus TaxID=402998 RepID=A0A9Q1RE84_9SOLA|nr:hypothetical protein K7X08_020165 [Anisodus acutangulus]